MKLKLTHPTAPSLYDSEFLVRQSDVSRNASSFTAVLFSSSFVFFCSDTALGSRVEDGDQKMYSGGSVVGEASLIEPEISPTPPLIFTGGQKV